MPAARSAERPLYDSCVASPWDHEPTDAMVYANWVRAGQSPFDLTLDFGYRRKPGPPAKFPVRVVMSWEHAKALRAVLDSALTDYEKVAGPIRELEGEVAPADDVPEIPTSTTQEDS
jgi:uncharacterized protein DUF3467